MGFEFRFVDVFEAAFGDFAAAEGVDLTGEGGFGVVLVFDGASGRRPGRPRSKTATSTAPDWAT